jgi:hypothetical protein
MRCFFVGSWLQQLKWKQEKFMQGRYGHDALSLDLCKAAIGCWVISLFFLRNFFMCLYMICLFWSLWRYFSKKHDLRRRELEIYEYLMVKPKRFIRQKRRQWQDRKTHRYFRCKCGTMLRVPKGKGKIDIHCKVCDAHMIRRT